MIRLINAITFVAAVVVINVACAHWPLGFREWFMAIGSLFCLVYVRSIAVESLARGADEWREDLSRNTRTLHRLNQDQIALAGRVLELGQRISQETASSPAEGGQPGRWGDVYRWLDEAEGCARSAHDTVDYVDHALSKLRKAVGAAKREAND